MKLEEKFLILFERERRNRLHIEEALLFIESVEKAAIIGVYLLRPQLNISGE